MTLNIFFRRQPHADRWLPGDHHLRTFVRRLLRGKPKIFGLERTFLNLRAGLDKIGVNYRVNDFKHASRHPEEPVGIVGTPYALESRPWENPIVFGPCGHSHPSDAPDLFNRFPVRRVLVYGPWMREMCAPVWGEKLTVWPVGIDTERWRPSTRPKDIDFLVYDKIMWDYGRRRGELLAPALAALERLGLKTISVRYGHYREEEYQDLLVRSKAMLFLCEHETQGIAYQQALSSGVPVLAWNQGMWLDPAYYPRIKAPASSVPYFDERCGLKFKNPSEFPAKLKEFLDRLPSFAPRDYVLNNLTLEACARRYAALVTGIGTRPSE